MGTSPYQPEPARSGMALCLSGGGFRAALFHLGALRRLNEVGLLSQTDTITSVSGGSIASGLLASVWTSLTTVGCVFADFEAKYETPLREFCRHDLRTGPLLFERLDPRNWTALWGDDHSATDFLAHAYRDRLVGDLRLKDLATIEATGGPQFIFDASNLQTGVNFVFSGTRVGDYEIGYMNAPQLPVAEAIAASSSFPLAFPPLVLKCEPGAFTDGTLARRHPPPPGLADMQRRVVLTDGGVYDNLGLEPVWKSHQIVLCSDGGKPFALNAAPGESLPSRLLRCQDVIGNQALAARKRWLISSFEQGVYQGAYWGVGTEIEQYPRHEAGYSGMVLERIRAVRTDLDAFSDEEQLVLMNHGWLLADAALRSYVSGALPEPVPRGACPGPELLDGQRAVAALARSDRLVRSVGKSPAERAPTGTALLSARLTPPGRAR